MVLAPYGMLQSLLRERDLQATRTMPEGPARVMKLMQLAESLLKNL